MTRIRLFGLAVVFLLSFFIVACDSGNNSGVVSQPAPSTGTIEVEQVLLRSVPSVVTQQRFTGFDAQGAVGYGPVLRPKAATITLEGVSTSVVRLQIEYLEGDTVVGLGSVAVTVLPGQTTVVTDPPFQDVVSGLSFIQITPAGSTIANGTAQQFIAIATFVDNSQLDVTSSATWTSSNPAAATVAPGGLATAVAPGSTTITAGLGTVSASANLTISTATIASIAVTPGTPVIGNGTTQQFTAIATLTDATTQDVTAIATWTSDTPATATVDAGTGLATAQDSGQTLITATVGTVSGSTVLIVTRATVESIAIEPPLALSSPGTKRQYKAVATLTDATTQDVTSLVTWSADNGVSVANDNLGLNNIGQATIPNTGATTPVTISAVLGVENANATLHLGRYAYVVGSTVSAYTIDPATGSLGNRTDATGGGRSVAVDPTGRFAYVAGGSSVSVFPIDLTTGALGSGTNFSAGSFAVSVAVDPTGRFAYVVNGFDNDVSCYTIDPITGALDNRTDVSAGVVPFFIAVDPTGRFAYVGNNLGDDVSAYTIDPDTGVLGNRTDTAIGDSVEWITVDPAGRFAYLGAVNKVTVLAIDPDTGALSNRTDFPRSGFQNFTVSLDPTGRFAYSAGYAAVSAYTINPTNGALENRTDTATVAMQVQQASAVDPTGSFLYLSNDNDISVFTIDPATGALNNRFEVPTAAGPASIATTP